MPPRPLSILDLVKLQVSLLEELDDSTVRALEPILSNAQTELRNELDRFSRQSFSRTQRQHNLYLIERSLASLYNRNVNFMEARANNYNLQGFLQADKEVRDLSREVGLSMPLTDKRVKVAIDHNSFLLNNMKVSLERYNAKIRGMVSRGLTDAVIQKRSGYEVTGRLGRYIDIAKSDMRRIVRTELAGIFNRTKLMTYEEFDKEHFKGELYKRMFHPMDHRTAEDSKEWAKADPAIPLNQPFKLKLRNGTIQEGQVPPLRPNDRAVLMPFYKKWKN